MRGAGGDVGVRTLVGLSMKTRRQRRHEWARARGIAGCQCYAKERIGKERLVG
jgi:hypothetical protein